MRRSDIRRSRKRGIEGSLRSTVLAPSILTSGLLAAAACSAPEPPATFAGTRWDSAGMEIVLHAPPGSYPAPVYRPEYHLVVSDTLPGGAGEFGSVEDAELLPRGRLAVLDAHSANVRVFSPDGTLDGTVARQGEGPGEISGNFTLGIIRRPDGGMILPDLVRSGLVAFDSAGGYVETLPWNPMAEPIPQWRSLAGDTLAVLIQTDEANTLVVRTLEGEWRDTLVSRPVPPDTRRAADGRRPLLPYHLLWAASGTGLVAVASMQEASLALYREGALLRFIRWEREGAGLSPEEKDHLLSLAARANGDPTGNPVPMRGILAPPGERPALADLALGPDVVLAQRVRPVEEMDRRVLSLFAPGGFGGRFWDVFSWEGSYLGVLDFQAPVEVFRIRGDTVVGVREDSLGVAHPFLAFLPREMMQVLHTPETGS